MDTSQPVTLHPSESQTRKAGVLELISISKKFGTISAIEDVNLSVSSGSIHAILGPNGSGKTTLLKIISGLVKPSAGSAMVLQKPVSNKNILWIRRHIAFVLDEDDVIDDLTPREYLRFIATLYNLPDESDQRIEQLLELVGMTKDANRLCRAFSHGMRKKIQLTAALLPRAPLFVIDEPTNGLDPDVAILVRELLLSLKKEGFAVLLATHNLHFAQAVVDHVTLLRGQVFAQGTLKQILRRAQTDSLETAYLKLTNTEIDYEAIHAVTTAR